VTQTTRRTFLLRGALGAGAVAVGLPLLDCFLDGNGEAMAAEFGGGRLPVRFGTWFWGCGMIPSRWTPKATGADFDLPPELAPIAPVRQHISVLSNFNVELDGRANLPHLSGATGMRTGDAAESWQQIAGPTFDVEIGDAIGSGSYFRALDLSADGNSRSSLSFRNGSTMNPPTSTAAEVYQQVFGPDFRDPNAATFSPDPKLMLRRSVLSGVTEKRQRLLREVGSSDRARLDQYFTAVRELEQKLSLQLQKPPPAEACRAPTTAPGALGDLSEVGERRKNHRLMADLLAMALACNQTKVFNMAFSGSAGAADLRQPGATTAYHQSTHEEMVDRSIGYQPQVDVFATECMHAWAEFVSALAAVKEGDGTLLDNTLVLAHSEVSFAKTHDVTGLPMMFAGRAGGRVRPGLHIDGGGSPVSRAVLTAQQVMGLPVDAWGRQSMRTTKPISEITT
jgi:hypothetical protein